MESFLQHINKQVRHSEEQESLAAAAQRIGPYEVLEPSSEEIEKVRKRKRLIKSKVPRKMDGAEAWRRRGRGATRRVCPMSSPSGEGPGGRVQNSRKETLKRFLSFQVEEGWKETVLGLGRRTALARRQTRAPPSPLTLSSPCPSEPASILQPGPDVPRAGGCS